MADHAAETEPDEQRRRLFKPPVDDPREEADPLVQGQSYNYTVDPLPISKIPPCRRFLIIGKSYSGKTTILVELMYKKQAQYQFGMAMAASIGSQEDFRKFMPDTYIHNRFDTDALKKFWLSVKRTNGRIYRRHGKDAMLQCFLILDDTGFDAKMWNDPTLKELLMIGRHYGLDIFVCLQYMKAVSPPMREQFDYVFIFREKSPENCLKLYNTFGGANFGSRTVFDSVFAACTFDYRSLVIKTSDINPNEGQFEGAVWFYKARHKDEIPQFVVGSDEYWRRHYLKYNEHYQSDEEEIEEGLSTPAKKVANPTKKSRVDVTLRKK